VKKIILKIIFSLLMICIFKSVLFIRPVKANLSMIYVDDDNLAGPWHGTPEHPYQNITSGLEHASSNDTIFVYDGIYRENVVVNKTLSLIGENRDTTIIDGNNNGTVIRIIRDNVAITGFTIQNSGTETTDCGIFVWRCAGVTISHNTIRNSLCGINLRETNCSHITGNLIANNSWMGVYISPGDGNKIYFNTINQNGIGVYVRHHAVPNTLYDNNFIDNPTQAEGTAEWDNGAEGNYWSDYPGEDRNGDGIGDTDLPHLGIEYRPLIGLVTLFNAGTWQQTTYYVHISSKSTVSQFQFNSDEKVISFNIDNKIGNFIFCRVAIPRQLMWCDYIEEWQVMANTTQIPYNATQNDDYTYIYFAYNQPTLTVYIKGTHIVREFPESRILWILIIVTFTSIIIIKQRKPRDMYSKKQ